MADYDTMDDSDAIEFNLYEILSHDATLRQGEVKSYNAKEGGTAIYARKESDFSVTVQKLLWVDGLEKTTLGDAEKEKKQEMTLVVLKLVLASHSPDSKFSHVKASLAFEDPEAKKNGGKNEPQVQAWAPFNEPERWNASVSHRKRNDKAHGGAKLGYSGVELSAGRSRDDEITWEKTSFDEGRANEEISRITGRPNGLTWTLEQNALEAQGVSPEVWVAVLLSRPSTAAYLVKFRIDVRAGPLQEFLDKTRRFFGLKPGQTNAFLMTPGKERFCNHEGEHILQGLDLGNLGELRQHDRRNLKVQWGPAYKIEIPKPATKQAGDKSPGVETREENRGGDLGQGTTANAAKKVLHSNGSLQSHAPTESDQPSTIAAADPKRLTALEGRTAQLEARLVTHESTMLQLQQAVARLEHAGAKPIG